MQGLKPVVVLYTLEKALITKDKNEAIKIALQWYRSGQVVSKKQQEIMIKKHKKTFVVR